MTRLLAFFAASAMLITFVLSAAGDTVSLQVGDADQNGVVNTTDARLVLQHAAMKQPLNPLTLRLCDVDGNGAPDTTDSRMILQFAAEKRNLFPAEELSVEDYADSLAAVRAFEAQNGKHYSSATAEALELALNAAEALPDTASARDRSNALLQVLAALVTLESA